MNNDERIKELAKGIADRHAANHGVALNSRIYAVLLEDVTKALREVHQLGYDRGFNAGMDEGG